MITRWGWCCFLVAAGCGPVGDQADGGASALMGMGDDRPDGAVPPMDTADTGHPDLLPFVSTDAGEMPDPIDPTPLPLASHCFDGAHDGNETDIDCGGDCVVCAAGRACARAIDCESGACSAGRCAAGQPSAIDFQAARSLFWNEPSSGQSVVADFDGDGKPDVAALAGHYLPMQTRFESDLVVRKNLGGLTFAASTLYSLGSVPDSPGHRAASALRAADLDGDGILDVGVDTEAGFAVLTGKGDGTFRPMILSGAGRWVTDWKTTDFNEDGKADLASVSDGIRSYGNGVVLVQLGDGSGHFVERARLDGAFDKAVRNPSSLAVADLNGDGHADVLFGNGGAPSVGFLAGKGDGTFAAPTLSMTPLPVLALALADLDRDGRQDLVVLDGEQASWSLLIYLGDGKGGFQLARTLPLASRADTLFLADLDHDGTLDLIAGSNVFLGTGGTAFRVAPPLLLDATGGLADLDGDGHLDAFGDALYGLHVARGRGDGTFVVAAAAGTAEAQSGPVVLADFNGDGHLDAAAVFAEKSYVLRMLAGRGDGTFEPPANPIDVSGFGPIIGGDWNRDGRPDIALVDGSGIDLIDSAGGQFGAVRPISVASMTWDVTAGDFDGDGWTDFAAASGDDYTTRGIHVLLADGGGLWRAPVAYPSGARTELIATADLDGDGHLDLVAESLASRSFRVLLGRGDGTFQATLPPLQVDEWTYDLRLADLDGDGRLDLALLHPYAFAVGVHLGNGDGTFRPAIKALIPGGAIGLVAADFDRDGKLDLATSGHDTLSVLPGNGNGTFRFPLVFASGFGALAAGDLDGDGKPDLVASHDHGLRVMLNKTH